MSENRTSIDDKTRKVLADHIAVAYSVPDEQAAAMLEDAIKHGRASVYADQVWNVVGRVLKPIIDEINAVAVTPDPYSPKAGARVVAATSAALPELQGPPTS